jgi:lysophospholipase L1-like esterase
LENNGYFWFARHQEIVDSQKEINPEYVLIGDSITHQWEGLAKKNQHLWKELWENHRVINMGFGWDRTQNVLWRLENGEVENIHPTWIIVNIGTNNFTKTIHSRANSPEEISQAIALIAEKLRRKSPDSKILVMGVFPRLQTPQNPPASAITQLNKLTAKAVEGKPNVYFLDIGEQLLQPDGTVSKEIFFDGTHLTFQGYAIWGQSLRAFGIFNN